MLRVRPYYVVLNVYVAMNVEGEAFINCHLNIAKVESRHFYA